MSYVRLDYLNRHVHLARTHAVSTHRHVSGTVRDDPRPQAA
ncbi:hypothetical protein [Xanthomonas albilineans]|nr:hypothetical protein [Xanthomonas albilineans]